MTFSMFSHTCSNILVEKLYLERGDTELKARVKTGGSVLPCLLFSYSMINKLTYFLVKKNFAR